MSGSSSQRVAYHEAKPVVSPLGASTSIQCSPLVTSPSRTSVACSSSIIRVAGDAFQCRPAIGFSRFCSRRIDLDQQPGLPGTGHALGVADDHIGPERLAVLRDRGLERLGNVLTFRQHLIGQPERLLEHEANPLPVDRRSWRVAVPIVLPLVERQPQHPDMIRVVGVEPLGEDPLQHRHREERAGDLDQGEPFGVVAGGWHTLGGNWAGIHLRGDLAGPLVVGGPVLRLIDLGDGGISSMRQGKG